MHIRQTLRAQLSIADWQKTPVLEIWQKKNKSIHFHMSHCDTQMRKNLRKNRVSHVERYGKKCNKCMECRVYRGFLRGLSSDRQAFKSRPRQPKNLPSHHFHIRLPKEPSRTNFSKQPKSTSRRGSTRPKQNDEKSPPRSHVHRQDLTKMTCECEKRNVRNSALVLQDQHAT